MVLSAHPLVSLYPNTPSVVPGNTTTDVTSQLIIVTKCTRPIQGADFSGRDKPGAGVLTAFSLLTDGIVHCRVVLGSSHFYFWTSATPGPRASTHPLPPEV